LFGGARTVEGLTDTGGRNVEFAERFIRTEKIELVGGSLGEPKEDESNSGPLLAGLDNTGYIPTKRSLR
jgi:hypothetical protein